MLHNSSSRTTPEENITQLMKHHCKPRSAQAFDHERIRCRTDITCQKSKPDDYWTTNFRRRKDNLHKGYYSCPTEPYRPIGGQLILDPYDLMHSALPGTIDKKVKPHITGRGDVYEEKHVEMVTKDKSQMWNSSFASLDLENISPSAGYNDIKKLLLESRNRLTSVQAGRSYENHVKLVEEQRDSESRPDTGMLLQTVSSISLLDWTGSQPESRTSGQSTSRRPSGRRKPLLPTPMRNQLPLIQDNSGVLSTMQRKERLFKDHALYLKSIYDILTSLHNLKMKDLRSKVPLSKDVVERLKKEQLREEVNREESRRKSRGKATSTGLAMFNPVEKLPTVFQEQVHNNLKKKIPRNSIITTDHLALETWEDLINVQPGLYKEEEHVGGLPLTVEVSENVLKWYWRIRKLDMEKQSSATPRHANSITQHALGSPGILSKVQLTEQQEIQENVPNKAEKCERENAHVQQSVSSVHTIDRARRMPIWLQVAQTKTTVFQKLKEEAPTPDTAIYRFKRNLNKVKSSVQKENTAELEKIIRERIANFRLKFGTLNSEVCSVMFEEQKLMIQDAKDLVSKARLACFHIQPSKWYEELQEKTVAVVSSYSHPLINEMLLKLETFSHMDNKTVPYAKAKMCLLMMSLPAYDICQIHMQKALKFIFENILLGQDAQFHEWLKHRKLPYVIVNESRPRSGVRSPFKDK